MKPAWTKTWLRWEVLAIAAVAFYPPLCALAKNLFSLSANFGASVGSELSLIFIFGILALGLNVAVGYTGLLQLGIGAFFGVGAYLAGIFTVETYPFQYGFTAALVIATVGTALLGLCLGAPTLRLRGDYLAIVTLGFAEVVKVTLRNLEEITKGTKGLNPIAEPEMPGWLASLVGHLGIENSWSSDYRLFFYLNLFLLAAVVIVLRNLENSRLGRAWVALREDQLAATCMGINAPRVKMAAFAVSSAIAGLAGCLFASKLDTTAEPNTYDFSLSIITLCCVILGGLGSIRGTLIGVLILKGFELILMPQIDNWLQGMGVANAAADWARSVAPDDPTLPETMRRLLTLNSWKLMIFGVALVLMMRFRPEGLLPSSRIQKELHHEETKSTKTTATAS